MILETIVQIAAYSIFAFAAVLLVVQMLAKEVGYFFGRRIAKRHENAGEGVGVVVGGMLGLLAFVLALTLSFSSSRYQARQAGTLAEANAIGTAWLQAQAIGDPRSVEIARLLEEYTAVRRDFILADRLSASIGEANRRTEDLQSAMWGHLTALVRERPDPITASLMNALGAAFDQATAKRFSFASGFPPQLFWLLIGMSLLSMAALGFQLGIREKSLRLLSFLLLGMWTGTMTIILDMGVARVGGMLVSDRAYTWTLEGFRGGITIPAAPAR